MILLTVLFKLSLCFGLAAILAKIFIIFTTKKPEPRKEKIKRD